MLPASPGDRMLVCSDGLSGELDAAAIRRVLTSEADPQDAAEQPVQEAPANGGRDNVTAIVIDALAVIQHDPMDTLPRANERAALVGIVDDELDIDTVPRKSPRQRSHGGNRQ